VHQSDTCKFKQNIGAVCSIGSSRDLALNFANEDLQKGATAGGRVAVWPGPDGCRLVRDGNSAAMPPIATAPEFAGIGKMKGSPRIRRHSNSLSY